jgi:hypothetical protein
MLEVDLDASPRTLRFFVEGWFCFRRFIEQPVFITGIPQSINFAVCNCSSSPATLQFVAALIVRETR